MLNVKVRKVVAADIKALQNWQLDAAGRGSSLYYVTMTVANVGDQDLSGQRIPLYVLDGANALVESSAFKKEFKPCPSPALPDGFVTGEKVTVCQAYLVPKRGDTGRGQLPADGEVQPDHLGRQGHRAEGAEGVGEGRWGRMTALPTSLTLGSLTVETPVVLAPMAGITNAAYRRLCAEQGAGLYVCEMITSRGLVERDETTLKMLVFDDLEKIRSVQLYGTDPVYVGKAAEILCAEYGVAHIDLNFGCPVPKVTRKGGGGALPWKRGLLGEILAAAVGAATPYGVPVTMKTRKGIDEDHLTYLDAGRIAEDSGCAAIALHGRTVAQSYSGEADWDAIARLVEHVSLPVLGNGDIWEAGDAVRMVEQTGAAGVVVGRGCLGRPWLFRDLAAAFAPGGPTAPVLPALGEVRAVMRRHAELLCEHMGEERGCKEFRKHVSWYLKGFRAGGTLRHSLALVDSLASLDALLDDLDPAEPFPVSELGTPRGRQGSPRAKVALPEGWLDDADGAGSHVQEESNETTGG